VGSDGHGDRVESPLTAEGSQLQSWGRDITRRDLLKIAGATAAVAALTPIAAACGGGGGGAPAPGGGGQPTAASGKIQPPATKVNLDFWNGFTGEDGPYLRRLVDEFNKQTPNVAVKFTTQKDLYAALAAAKTANRLPHVSIVHLDQIPQQSENQVFQPIDDLISTLGLSAGNFTEDVWKNGEWKGKRYGVPLDIHTMNMYWNKALFRDAGLDPEKPPATQDEFINAAKAITQKGTAPGYMVVQGGPGANFLVGIQWSTWYYQQGGTWVDDAKSAVNIDTDKAAQAAQFIKRFLDEGISPKGVSSDSEIAAFQAKKNGIVLSGIWTTNAYAKALGQDLGAAPVPKIFGDGVWAGSHHMGITTKQMSEDEKRGAQYFIDWISSNSLEWAKAGQIPAKKEVRDSSEFKAIPYIAQFAEQVPNARFFPAVPGSPAMLFDPGGAGEAAVNFITGRTPDAKAAFEKVKQTQDQKLKENKTKFNF